MNKILILPVYNETDTVIKVLEETVKYVDKMVIIDDGSTDSSKQRILEWMKGKKNVHLLTLRRNKGMAYALKVSFFYLIRLLDEKRISLNDILVNIDADGQHKAGDIPEAIEYMNRKNLDVLLAERDLSPYPWYKRLGNPIISTIGSLLSGFKYNDIECGLRFIKIRVIPSLLKYYTGFKYSCAQEIGIITARLKYKIDNNFPTQIIYYRPRTKLPDVLINLIMGTFALLRVVFALENDVKENFGRILYSKNCEIISNDE